MWSNGLQILSSKKKAWREEEEEEEEENRLGLKLELAWSDGHQIWRWKKKTWAEEVEDMRLIWAEVWWEHRQMLETLELVLYFHRTWMLKMKRILAGVGEGSFWRRWAPVRMLPWR